MTWRRVGPYLEHGSGYRAPVHSHALAADVVPEHVARQPWCTPRDLAEFRGLWEAERVRAEQQRRRDDERSEDKRRAGITGHVPRWARAGNHAAEIAARIHPPEAAE